MNPEGKVLPLSAAGFLLGAAAGRGARGGQGRRGDPERQAEDCGDPGGAPVPGVSLPGLPPLPGAAIRRT